MTRCISGKAKQAAGEVLYVVNNRIHKKQRVQHTPLEQKLVLQYDNVVEHMIP